MGRNGAGPPEGVVEICCKGIIATVVAAGLTALFIWVGLRGFEPICILHDLQLPAVANSSAAAAANHTVYFNLILHNRNKDTGIYYDPLSLNFSYKPPADDVNSSRISPVPVGSAAVPGFHQGGGKDTKRDGSFVSDGDGWRGESTEAVKADGKAVFRVDLKTEIRYKIVFWKTKRHRLEVRADVSVDTHGGLILKRGFLKKEKGIKLTSAAGVLLEEDGCGVLVRVLLLSAVALLIGRQSYDYY